MRSHMLVMMVLLTVPWAAAPARGESRVPARSAMSLDELVRIAEANNPTLAQARRRIEALRGEQLQVGLRRNPEIAYAGEEIGDEGRSGLQGAFMTQEIVTAGKLELNRAVVSHEIAAARQSWLIQRQRVANDVLAAAYQVLAAQRTIDVAEQLVQIGEQDEKTTETFFEAKEIGWADVLQARIEVSTARLRRDNARNEYRSAWRRLSTLMGTPGMSPTRLADALEAELPELQWDPSLDRLLARSPELARAYAEIERAQCALARANAGRVPDVEIAGGVLYNGATENTVASVGVAVPLQLFNRNQGNIARASAELAAAHREVRRVELSLEHRLAEAFEQYVNARQRVERYRQEILPDAKASLELVQQGYRGGEFSYLELLTAQRTYFQSNLAYVPALGELHVAAIRIEGMLLEGGLDRPEK